MSTTKGFSTGGSLSVDKLNINNNKNISDIILLNNNNNSEYSNLVINYDNKYLSGLVNNKYTILSNNLLSDGLFNENEYFLSIDNCNINFKNSNINYIFHDKYNINDDNYNNILQIDNNTNSIKFEKYDILFKLENNNFNITSNEDTLFKFIDDDDTNIYDINTNKRALFNCDLRVNNIYVDTISPATIGTAIKIEAFSIEKNILNDVSIGQFNQNSDISKNTTPLIINTNINNDNNTNSIIKINKYSHMEISDQVSENYNTLFELNNEGFFNIGYSYNIYNSNSFVNINNASNNNVPLILNYDGEFLGDSFNITKYGNIAIGDNFSNNSLIFVNRNDDRLNYDITNSHNINSDNPLLKLNINYNTSNNYLWKTEQKIDYFLQDIFENIYWNGDTTQSDDFYTSYKNNFINIFSTNYNKFYIDKDDNIADKYFFINSPTIANNLNYDLTKLNLNKSNNKSNNDNINIKYNNLNLLNNINQIEYDFKTISIISEGITSYIFYPDKLSFKNADNTYNNIDIDFFKMTNSISSVRQHGDHIYTETHLLLLPSSTNNIGITDYDIAAEKTKLAQYLRSDIFNFTAEQIKTYITSTNNDIGKYFREFTCMRYVDNFANGLNWEIKTSPPNNTLNISNNIIINETLKQLLQSKTPSGTIITLAQSEWDTLNIDKLYCESYLQAYNQDGNTIYFTPVENIKPLFVIHISKQIYNAFGANTSSSYNQLYTNYIYDIINKPEFFHLTSNNSFISSFTNDGLLTFTDTSLLPINSNNYSIYSKDKDALFNKIDINKISTTNITNNIDFDNKNITNIGQIILDTEQSFNIFNLDVNNITNINSKKITVNNTGININALKIGLKWNYHNSIPTNCIELIPENIADQNDPINKLIDILTVKSEKIYNTDNYNDIILKETEIIEFESLIHINSYVKINKNSIDIYFKQGVINDYTKNLLFDNLNDDSKYYNNIININSTNNTIYPTISIYGSNPSYLLKTNNNPNLNYYSTIRQQGFHNLSYVNSDGINDIKDVFEISYSKQFENWDQKFNLYNTRHLLQHIGNDYNMITLGENYNICIDNQGPSENSEILHTDLLSSNTSNSTYKVSIGIPHKSPSINTSDNLLYLYNYPRYFQEIVKNSDYMLNIYGNTIIHGIDGDSTALSVKINDNMSSNSDYKTNISIGSKLIYNSNVNTLNVNGDIYSDIIYYKNDDQYYNVSNIYYDVINDIKNTIFQEELKSSVIHTSNINNYTNPGIFNLELIPNIPMSNFSIPEPPIRTTRIKSYNHPILSTNSLNTLTNHYIHVFNSEDIYNHDITLIDNDDNGYHYFKFTDTSTSYTLNIQDNIDVDLIIVGGGGGGGHIGGGNGGEYVINTNLNFTNGNSIIINIGKGGSAYNDSNSNPAQNGSQSSFSNYTANGGFANINAGNAPQGNNTTATNAYQLFPNIFDDIGHIVNTNELWFGGNGANGVVGGNGGGGGGNAASSVEDGSDNSGGGGGYNSQLQRWGNGGSGIILMRYKFIIKEEYNVEQADISTLTNTYLEYNWTSNKWMLNEYIADTCNILLNNFKNTSNNIIVNFDHFTNLNNIKLTENSNSLININNSTSNYISDLNDNLLILDNNNSNYIGKIETDIKNLDTSNITSGLLNIDRIPLIPFNKFSNLDLSTIYSPKVNHTIVEYTNYYKTNLDYTENFIILNHSGNTESQTEYFIEFQYDCTADILIVGGGGGGGGVDDSTGLYINSGGGGGGAIIESTNIPITKGSSYTIKVGKGGLTRDNGYSSQAFGVVANGGKKGQDDGNYTSIGNSLGGEGGIADISSALPILDGTISYHIKGGNGGTSSRNNNGCGPDNDTCSTVEGMSGNPSSIFGTEYRWGGGGGGSRWYNNNDISITGINGTKYGSLPNGGVGGGGAGAIRSNTLQDEIAYGGDNAYTGWENTNGMNITNNNTNTNDKISGGMGANNTGGGGGGGINNWGGNGGSGIVVIKYYNLNLPSVPNRTKGYLAYNYNSDRWEMNSLELINLNIDFTHITDSIATTKEYLLTEINSHLDTAGNIIRYELGPNTYIGNPNMQDKIFLAHNIFGYMGKTSNLDPNIDPNTFTSEEIEQYGYENGLITLSKIPGAYDGTIDNPYYSNLIHGDKFKNNSITNSHIANNSIDPIKLANPIDGSKIKSGSILSTSITGDFIYPITILEDSRDPTNTFPIDKISSANLDISLLDFGANLKISGVTNITSNFDNDIKLPIDLMNDISIDINSIDINSAIIDNATITSSNNDIPLDILDNIYINISNIENYGNSDFIISNINLFGDITQEYISKVHLNVSNISSSTLENTIVEITNGIIDPGIIYNLQIYADQIDDTSGTFLQNVTLNTTANNKLNPSVLNNITVTPTDIDFTLNTLDGVSINTSLDKINPAYLSNISILPSDINLNDNNILSNITINTLPDNKINPSYLSNISILPSDIDFSDNKLLSNVTINTITNNKINPSDIGNIILTPDQFNNAGQFNSVTLHSIGNETIDPSLILSDGSIIIYSSNLKTGIIPSTTDTYYKLPSGPTGIQYDFPPNSIDPTLIADGITIHGNMIDITSANKLNDVIITGNIDTISINDGATITGTITNNANNKIQQVSIETSIDISFIDTAIINNQTTLTTTLGSTFSGITYISGDLPVNYIKDTIIIIDNTTTSLITLDGNPNHFNGVTTIKGHNIDASFINDAIININSDSTSLEYTTLQSDTYIGGTVTITGTLNASHITNPVVLNLQNGVINGTDISDNSITSSKLTNLDDIYVDKILLGVTNKILDDTNIYLKQEINSNFISIDNFSNIYNIYSSNIINDIIPSSSDDDKLILPLWYNSGIINKDLPLFIDNNNNISISTYNEFSSYIDNKASIIINSKNNNSRFKLETYYISDASYEITNIGNKLHFTETYGGSIISIGNSRLSIIVHPNGISNSSENVMEFSSSANYSHKDLHVTKIIFADNSFMDNASILDSNKQIVMNNSVSGFNYGDTQVTGEGFIHCNGIHAQFDITAYSSTTQSDKNLKNNINPLQYNNEILKLNPVTFKWNDINKSNTCNVGFIAQEIETILPDLVKEGLDNYKSVNYTSLIPYLVKHIQNLENRILILEQKNNL